MKKKQTLVEDVVSDIMNIINEAKPFEEKFKAKFDKVKMNYLNHIKIVKAHLPLNNYMD